MGLPEWRAAFAASIFAADQPPHSALSNAAAPVRAQRLVCHLPESNQTVAMLAGGTKTPMAWKTSHLYGDSKSQPVSLYALVIHAAADAIPITAIANTIDVSFIASPLLFVPLLPKPPVSKRLQSIVRLSIALPGINALDSHRRFSRSLLVIGLCYLFAALHWLGRSLFRSGNVW